MSRENLKNIKRVVIKVGSNVLYKGGEATFTRLAKEVKLLRGRGIESVIVSSGAIAKGLKRLGRVGDVLKTIPERQAVAAIGQSALMARFEDAFGDVDVMCAQMLLTHGDLSDRQRFLNAKNTLQALKDLNVVAIINENDTVATEEIKFGDNDNLASLVVNLFEADLLIMLSDIDGLCDKNPKKFDDAKIINEVKDIDELKVEWEESSGGSFGTGGIKSKVLAASKAAHFGAAVVIANGLKDNTVTNIIDGNVVGTYIHPEEDMLTSRKHWIAYSSRPTGKIILDDGAKTALMKNGKSLLPTGIKEVVGIFSSGEVVHLMDEGHKEFARGMVNYSSAELDKIKGLKTDLIEDTLGFIVSDVAIHRDNLVIL